MFLKALIRVSMCVHHPQGVSYYICQSYKVYKMATFVRVIVTENQ
jgi:hypothetical protein